MNKLHIILILLLLTGFQQVQASDSVIVKLSASGEVEVKPDLAEFNATVNCVSKEISQASRCVKSKLDEITLILEKAGIDKEDYHSSAINLNKEYSWDQNTQVFKGYSASVSLMITIRDLDTLGLVLGNLMNQENLSIGGLSYTHSKLDALNNDAYIKAFRNTEILAKRFQKEVGGNSIELVEINNTTEPLASLNVKSKSLMSTMGKPEQDSIHFNIGTLVLRKEIKALYRIKK